MKVRLYLYNWNKWWYIFSLICRLDYQMISKFIKHRHHFHEFTHTWIMHQGNIMTLFTWFSSTTNVAKGQPLPFEWMAYHAKQKWVEIYLLYAHRRVQTNLKHIFNQPKIQNTVMKRINQNPIKNSFSRFNPRLQP